MGMVRGVKAILALVAILAVCASPLLAASPALAEPCTGYCQDRLVQVGLQGRVVQLVAGAESTCALTEAGDVYCWSADRRERVPLRRNPLLLVTIGMLLVAGGATLLTISRR
jgi:Regulator of chromosome condensation (RCC1) repeat